MQTIYIIVGVQSVFLINDIHKLLLSVQNVQNEYIFNSTILNNTWKVKLIELEKLKLYFIFIFRTTSDVLHY